MIAKRHLLTFFWSLYLGFGSMVFFWFSLFVFVFHLRRFPKPFFWLVIWWNLFICSSFLFLFNVVCFWLSQILYYIAVSCALSLSLSLYCSCLHIYRAACVARSFVVPNFLLLLLLLFLGQPKQFVMIIKTTGPHLAWPESYGRIIPMQNEPQSKRFCSHYFFSVNHSPKLLLLPFFNWKAKNKTS